MPGIRRALSSSLLAAAVLACAFALESSLACPIEVPPQPLRTLYKESARVVVARVEAKEVLKTEDDMASVRVALRVTENVKGAPAQLIHFYHNEFVGKGAEKEEERSPHLAYSERITPRLKRGERYLFFLDAREEGDGYEANDEDYAVKQLSDEDLKVYLERMKELADIIRERPEDKHAVVEWLVRCAEQPATRWEGAYELFESAQAAARGDETQGEAEAVQPQSGEESSEAPAEGEVSESQESAAPAESPDSAAEAEVQIIRMPGRFRYTEFDPALAPLLNAVQKQRLADALVASSEPGEGDDYLMRLVKDFGDPRLPHFLLARLHRFADEAPMEAELWVRTLADVLREKRLVELADSYTQNTAYYEWEEEPEAEAPTGAPAEEEEAAAEVLEETPEDLEAQAARTRAAAERATLRRSAMLKEFLAHIDLLVATGQLASN